MQVLSTHISDKRGTDALNGEGVAVQKLVARDLWAIQSAIDADLEIDMRTRDERRADRFRLNYPKDLDKWEREECRPLCK